MKYSNTAITQLSRWYKQILIKCAIINAAILAGATMLATPAMAEVTINTSGLTVDVSTGSTSQPVAGTATITGLGTMATEDAANYSTTTQMNSAISTATTDMATQTWVGSQGYQKASDVNTAISTSIASGDIKTALDGKQGTLTTNQLAAVNSGITADKVTTYDGYQTTIDAVNDTTTGLAATNAIAVQNKTDIATINGNITTINNKIGTADISLIGDGTITGAISVIDQDLGDVSAFTGSTTGNISNSLPGSGTNATNVSGAVANIDATIGQIHGLAAVVGDDNGGKNLQSGSTVSGHLTALAGAIGDRSNIGSANTAINTATATSVADGLKAAGDAIGNLQYTPATAVAYGNLTANTNLTTVAAQLAYNIGAAVTNTTNGVAANASVNANINALNTAMGNVASLGVNGYTATAAGANLVAGVTALNNNMKTVLGGIYKDDGTYDNSILAGNGFETGTNLSDSLNKYAENVATAMGTTFAANGSFENKYDTVTAVNYAGVSNDKDLVTAIGQLNANIGAALTTVANRDNAFKLAADNTVNANLAKLDAAIGGEVSATYGNITTATAVNANLDLLDAAIGDRSNIGSANAAINTATATSVADGLKAAGDAIGDADFTTTNYASGDTDISSAVRSLDSNLYRLDNDVRDLRKDMKRGFASMAAMSAMMPNARASGNTQLSVGTGMYSGHAGFALGGFHWFNDNLMMNVGVAYGDGDSSDMIYRAGVTYSW